MMNPLLIKGLVAAGGISLSGVGIWQFTEYLRPKTIREKLEREGEVFHSLVAGEDPTEWKEIAKRYARDESSSKINGVTIENKEDPSDEKVKLLQGECKKLIERGLSGEYEKDLNNARRWCVAIKPTDVIPGN